MEFKSLTADDQIKVQTLIEQYRNKAMEEIRTKWPSASPEELQYVDGVMAFGFMRGAEAGITILQELLMTKKGEL